MTGQPQILQARARSGLVDFGPRPGMRAHGGETDPHTGPAEQALCGRRTLHARVMLPAGGLEDCPRCLRADAARDTGGADQRPVQPTSPANSST